MSLEDDTENGEVELQELVTQTLEETDVLSKIKAQLRAGLYLALENDINTGSGDYNDLLKAKLRNPDMRIIFSLVREFLEYFELNFTCSVFEKESLMGTSYNYNNREKLIQELDIGIDALHNSPLLLEILNIARSSFNLSVRDIQNQNDTKFNSTENNDDNKNSTYDIIAQDKQEIINQSTDSSSTEVSQHIIDVKTIPKDVTDSETKSQPKSKTSSVQEEIQTHQSEIVVSGNPKNGVKDLENDDTYEGTSSIAEDSVVSNKEQTALIDFDKSIKVATSILSTSPVLSVTKNIIDQTIEDNVKSPRLSLTSEQNSTASGEKRKLDKSDRLDKLKPMSALSSLSDLPPLQLNKSRNSDTVLLPSLYSKREKTGMKDFDKLFDISYDSLDNYEEDFLSSTSLENDDNKLNMFNNKLIKMDEHQTTNRSEKLSNVAGKNPIRKESTNNGENGNHINDPINSNKQEQGSNTSISEDFDINSNIDDILKSSSTT